ncbi:5-(carboxyamino)imidazole ribonucleotide synthase [Lacicoccus alkaliphilus]|uniref:N5-carboxyaminoimidazole ribonucleotide synthase n=1 Tax=Lacicoccus alkaliphilus DSM 16010 TaxID=1123231 RepID=A0A1M7CQF7_9BACL|nr:5-(carboxyamino)imidazole ribonucleotide synthase [Salinicoccus alkaliphilus]SHL69422.1 5-(carboxyamino)imidazole ribonucleotide synthase [Salinicoccus alkaliphilus DSM 16010]
MTLSRRIYPGATIGIIGGGQLGKMLAQSALRMGYKVAVLDPSEDAPAKATSHLFINAAFDDEEALKQLGDASDIITYEFENIDGPLLEHMVSDYYVPQGAGTLLALQNRETEKGAVEQSGAKVVPFASVAGDEDVRAFAEKEGWPVIVKTATGGYDGKGQYVIDSDDTLENEAIPYGDTQFIAEKYLDLEREVSLTVARSTNGETIIFPLQENLHRNQILYRTIAPSRIDVQKEAEDEVKKIMNKLHFTGVFTIEFFIDTSGALYVNEIAPRPHNSAHHTIESCSISQFDAHILAVTGQPMPKVLQHGPAVMMNLLGQDLDRLDTDLYEHPEWHVHLYGKTARKPERKMGHVTMLADDVEETLERLKRDFEKE